MNPSPNLSCRKTISRPKAFSIQAKPPQTKTNPKENSTPRHKRGRRATSVIIRSTQPTKMEGPEESKKSDQDWYHSFIDKVYERAILFLDKEGLDIICPTSQTKTSTVLKPCLTPAKLKSIGLVASRASTNDGESLGDIDILEKAVPKFLLKRALSFLTETSDRSCQTLCDIKQENCFPVSLVLEQQSLADVDSVIINLNS